MNQLIQSLLSRRPVVTDGAWGTELQTRGLPSGQCPDEWNLTHRDEVSEVAQAYVKAGSQIILTNTFGANRVRLAAYGLEAKAKEINRAGVEISRQAAQGRAFVFASIGPSGKFLLTGKTTPEELRVAFAEQAQALAEAKADALVVETMADLAEARLAVAAAKATGLPVVACMVFDSGKNRDRTNFGVTPEQAVVGLLEAGADVVGANCGLGIAGYIPVCQRLHAAANCPIWIKPNAGLPIIEEDQIVYRTSPQEFADQVPALVQAGASFLGGCCGTNPRFIQALKNKLTEAE